MLQFIERMARISHRSEDRQTDDSWKRFIPAVVQEHGDWSVVEHASLTVVFRVDRGICTEIRTHRFLEFGSFTQESTRFVNYGKRDLDFVRPAKFQDNSDAGFTWRDAMGQSERAYLDLLRQGVRPQEARSVLPNALAASIACTSNLRNWRHVFMMRVTKETHPDFVRLTDPLLKTFQTNIPLIFDDIEPGLRQIDNLKHAR